MNSTSLDWFRKVVDNKTSIGHKDMAISVALLSKISPYKPSVVKYKCPWVFSSETEQSQFLYQKFGFSLDSGNQNYPSEKEVSKLAETELGVKHLDGFTFLGWNLGIAAIWKGNSFDSHRRFSRLATSLLVLIGLLGFALFLRSVFGIYVSFSWEAVLIFVITLPIGVIFGESLQHLSIKYRE